jgi:hypothetical protein
MPSLSKPILPKPGQKQVKPSRVKIKKQSCYLSSGALKNVGSPRPTDTPLIKGGRGDRAQNVLSV